MLVHLRNSLVVLLLTLVFAVPAGAGSISGLKRKGIDISKLDKQQFQVKWEHDLAALQILNQRMDGIENILHPLLDSLKATRTQIFALEQRQLLKHAWAQFLDVSLFLQKLVVNHERFFKLKRQALFQSYSLGYGAYVLLYASGLWLIDRTINQEHFEVLLDEEQPEYGIAKGQYTELKWNVIHINDVSRLMDGYNGYKYLCRKHKRRSADAKWLDSLIEANYLYAKTKLKKKGPSYFGKNALDIMKDHLKRMVFPAQKHFAMFLGHSRATLRQGGLVSVAQCNKLISLAQPGDILFERKEWVLSNMGLPGFWTHVALYLGNRDELAAWSDDPDIHAYYRSKDTTYTCFVEYLEQKYPAAFAEYMMGQGKEPFRIIEALSHGVVFTTVQGSPGICDYLACVRPKLAKRDIAQAIELAFHYWDRDYDYHFNFLSDHTLVCTELIYKCYEPGPGKNGLNLDLTRIVGVLTLPPNHMVAQFEQELGKKQQMQFILFLDGDEENGIALEKNVTAFCNSHNRPRWQL